jgi:hypothetical protein
MLTATYTFAIIRRQARPYRVTIEKLRFLGITLRKRRWVDPNPLTTEQVLRMLERERMQAFLRQYPMATEADRMIAASAIADYY